MLLALALSTATLAAEPWTAKDKWSVEYAANECLAMRRYNDGSRNIVVVVSPSPASGDALLKFVVADPKRLPGEIEVRVAGVSIRSRFAGAIGVNASNERVYSVLLHADEVDRLLNTGKLAIKSGPLQAELTLTSVDRIKALLDSCEADLLKRWGFPDAANLSAYATPDRSIVSYIGSNDYPGDAISERAMGTTRAMVTIGPDGTASNCRLLQSAGHASLDKATCTILLKRPRYTPARNAAGQPVAAPVISAIRWVLPGF